jgi:hypothetical protein
MHQPNLPCYMHWPTYQMGAECIVQLLKCHCHGLVWQQKLASDKFDMTLGLIFMKISIVIGATGRCLDCPT